MNTMSHMSTRVRSIWRTSAIALVSVLLASTWMVPAQAHAITREDILRRAHGWVRKGVIYSQVKYYRGYRRDCSGFVSMSWAAKRSYTTRTIGRVSHRIRMSSLRPGDAVLTPGRHVALFVKWKSKRHRTYVAMEEASRGKPAFHRVRHIRRGDHAIRYDRVHRKVLVASVPTEVPVAVDETVAAPAAPSVAPTGSLDTTLTWTTGDALALFNAGN
jgi:hypothetical protein